MKGLILAGGSGSRLYPTTWVVSKQLLPLYDKPMIYYPLSTLMMAGIREILIITRPDELELFKRLLSDGSQWGIEISYAVQESPNGLGEAFVLGADFIGDSACALILGDNTFYGSGLFSFLEDQRREFEKTCEGGARVFTYPVRDPERYAVIDFDEGGHPASIEEKPTSPRSHDAVVGLYFYDHHVVKLARNATPSERGEIEITDINRRYLERDQLQVTRFGRGYTWFDAGTHEAMMQAAFFTQAVEERQGLKIACPEEIALRKGFISRDEFLSLAARLAKSSYGEYLNFVASTS
ncbi:glucose-1-phosphate thymidylyltransferase RfbA [Spiribacter sp. 218]|uniref:glucose-1-phosphate thymidylyltransferase RfbA n=1 Tax=Spiribacter pallidus TaxID=1987936 RepID=UPI00349F8DF9